MRAPLLTVVVGLVLVSTAAPADRRAALTTAGTSFEQLSRLADKARDEDRSDDAIQLYNQALKKRPEWDQGLWYLGTLQYEKEEYDAARDTLRRFMTLRPDSGPGWALLGLSEFQTREYSRALDHLQQAMVTGIGDRKSLVHSVFYYVAVLLTRFERFDESMDVLTKMIATDSDPSLLVEPAGLAGLRLPFLPAEIPPARKNLIDLAGHALVALQAEHSEGADAKFREIEQAYPNEPGVHFLCGAYLMQQHPEDGIREMKRELEISPSHVLARVRLAEQYLAQEQPDQALQYAAEAARLDPKRSSAHMLLGEALVAKSELAEGTKELETARDEDQMNSRIHWDLVRAFTKAGRTEDAEREKQQIKNLNSTGSRSPTAQDETSSEPARSR